MLDALIDQLVAHDGIMYESKAMQRDKWRDLARSMLNSMLIIGGIIVVGSNT